MIYALIGSVAVSACCICIDESRYGLASIFGIFGLALLVRFALHEGTCDLVEALKEMQK